MHETLFSEEEKFPAAKFNGKKNCGENVIRRKFRWPNFKRRNLTQRKVYEAKFSGVKFPAVKFNALKLWTLKCYYINKINIDNIYNVIIIIISKWAEPSSISMYSWKQNNVVLITLISLYRRIALFCIQLDVICFL